ncbi:unnamed protein product [Ilex paraguariensis]|uniref:DNA topoisomerase n=1 Tax=Ilex paraguariensis TaxID=185542 RepID=A0ABC8SK91_9AQUA
MKRKRREEKGVERFSRPASRLKVGVCTLPMQTPTLGFCVQRYLQIATFKPEKFWALYPYIILSGYELKLEWERNRLFDSDVAEMFQRIVMEDGLVEVVSVSEKQECKSCPSGLNTVNLLKVRTNMDL